MSAKKISRRDAIKLLGAALGATALANLPKKWNKPELAGGIMPAHAQTSQPLVLPTVLTQSIVDPNGIGFPPHATFTGEVTDEGSAPVTVRGFEWSANSNMIPVLGSVVSAGGGAGVFSSANIGIDAGTYYGRAYATNAVGTAYGNIIQFETQQCLAEGTLVALADGTSKKIEDINYSDLLLVWNFDEGRFDEAQPLWIKKAETTYKYNLIEFSDGSFIKTIHDHRIFNKEKGMFTYPMISEDAPIGTTTFNANGEEVTLTSKRVVHEKVDFYNIITHTHINLFANGILTSCRYNNIYPIVDMKFVKDDRVVRSQAEYGLEETYFDGLRLAEQTIPVAETVEYVGRLKEHDMETELAIA